jgi:hypothetical protein
MSLEAVLREVGNDDAYVKFLIAEKDYIRSALDARGVCFDEEYNASAYPSSIGSSIHCDLIEVEAWLDSLPAFQQKVVLEWANSLYNRPIRWPSRLAKVARILRERTSE